MAVADLDAFLQHSAALHHHLCPRQVLGVRIGMLAAELLDLELPQADKRLFIFVETDGCFADGVSAATGCWLGRRTMRLIDYGKVAATLVDTHTDRAVRIAPSHLARSSAAAYAPEAESRWHAQLLGYQRMPADQLLTAEPVALRVDLAALISRPGARVICARCAEEIMNEREVIIDELTLCRSCAGLDCYYVAPPA
jgi:formylmethanofuran dehydrogenase subunit E